MAEDDRRAGDWLHRDQRRRAREEGPLQQPGSAPAKWYDQTFWIVVFLVVFWPAGIVLAWRSRWPLAGKLLATLFVVACIYLALSMQAYVRGLS
ncbi:holotricin-3 [Adlercreutzia aquisgranensis]|uniref:holotricin-3 n=1 Tax=Adlercreutzia aquisgranensis TaxID=2941323 RepID=UPI00203E54F9|nr:holotricin-3 [Adlercreutzia aquisgranensis]